MARQAHNGDIIRVDHTFYAHYGVYVGGGTVIHYTDANGSDFKGIVQETSLYRNAQEGYHFYKWEMNCAIRI